MAEWELKAEFSIFKMSMLPFEIPLVGEALKAASGIAGLSPELEALLPELTEEKVSPGIRGLSHLASIFGSPMGFLPIFMNLYSSGLAKKQGMEAAREYETFRLPAEAIIRLWRRGLLDEVGLPEAFDDLKDEGWSNERITAAVRSTEIMPSPQDAVSFLAHEVFEPDMVTKYGLDDEWENVEKAIFDKIGMPRDIAQMYWRNHWQHTSFMQMVDLRRRDEIDDGDLWEWFKLVEIPPFWRKKLMALVWEVPTRVDVRRWLDMGTIDDAQLSKLYQRQGYYGEDNENYVLWTKVYNAFPDIIARYKKGWTNRDTIIPELEALGMTTERATWLFTTKIKKLGVERVTKERDLTISQIFKGVKMDKITREYAAELIVQMGYDTDEAALLLEINCPVDDDDKTVKDRQLSKADIRAGLKTGVIQPPEALERLIILKYTAGDSALLLSIFQAQITPPVDVKTRELTRADITAGVKKGILEPKEGFEALLDMDYSPENVAYILELKADVSPFSPATPSDFNNLVIMYRKALGMDFSTATEAAVMAESQLIRAQADYQVAQARQAPDSELAMYKALLDEAHIKFNESMRTAGE